MKAWTHIEYGPPEWLLLQDVDPPPVNPDDVLVRVGASTVNPYDRRHGPDRVRAAEAIADDLAHLVALLADDTLGVPVERTVAFADVPAGVAHGERRHTSGKVVITG